MHLLNNIYEAQQKETQLVEKALILHQERINCTLAQRKYTFSRALVSISYSKILFPTIPILTDENKSC